MRPLSNLIGKKFGRLLVISRNQRTNNTFWDCVCDCGNLAVITAGNLKNGHTQSCGCLNSEMSRARVLSHGKCGSTEYSTWRQMISRCTVKTNHAFKDYGGRGISVCKEWMSFHAFYADMGDKPHGTSIDRIDNNKGYSPDNCRWADKFQQARNTRANVFITHEGVTKCVSEWAAIIGCSSSTIRRRRIRHTDSSLIIYPARKQTKRNCSGRPDRKMFAGNVHYY